MGVLSTDVDDSRKEITQQNNGMKQELADTQLSFDKWVKTVEEAPARPARRCPPTRRTCIARWPRVRLHTLLSGLLYCSVQAFRHTTIIRP